MNLESLKLLVDSELKSTHFGWKGSVFSVAFPKFIPWSQAMSTWPVTLTYSFFFRNKKYTIDFVHSFARLAMQHSINF